MSAIDFIDHLLSSHLITKKIADKLRKQIEQMSKEVSAKSIAKVLVKKKLLKKDEVESALASFSEPAKDRAEEDDIPDLLPDESDEIFEVVEPITDLVEVPPEAPAVTVEAHPAVEEITSDTLDEEIAQESGNEALDEGPYRGGTSTKRKKKRKKYSSNRWDSPLMLAGGGTLLLMLFIGAALWFYLTRGTADEAFKLADEDYRAEAYMQAAAKFTEFVNDYPDDDNASIAKVRIVSAQIWNDVNRQAWESALERVQAELPTVLDEDAFDEIRPELASLLPNIMEGFAARADATKDMQKAQIELDFSSSALQEINKSAYLPTRFRKQIQPKLDAIQDIVKKVERNINRDKELDKRLREMTLAVEDGVTEEAYEIRRGLLRAYPGLVNNEQLRAKVLEITEKERDSVKSAADLPAVLTADHPKTTEFEVALATNSGTEASDLQGYTLFVLARGSVYGLDAVTGKVVWRRFVGFESTARPIATRQEANRDVIVVDARRNELLRLKGDTGELTWRLPCPGAISTPVLEGNQLLVSCRSDQTGLLFTVDVATGKALSGAAFPAALSCPAALNGNRVYQPGLHSSLFILDPENLACQDVVYVGHGNNSVVVAPIVVMDHIFVAENPAPNFSLLHIFAPDAENEGKLRPAMDPIRLDGQIVSPLTPFGKRILAVTDRGAVEVFEVDPRNAATPVKKAVRGITPSGKSERFSQSFFSEGRFWLGSTQLTRYELRPTRGTISQKWNRNQGDVFIRPMQSIGNFLFHVRQRKGKLGATVTAITITNGEDDGTEIWQTDIGVPPAGPVFINQADKTINVVLANATLFSLSGSQLKSNIVDTPAAQVQQIDLPPLETALEINSAKRVFFPGASSSTCVLYDPNANTRLQTIELSIRGGTMNVPPVLFDGKLIIPTTEGAVYLIDPNSGQAAAHEFQPALSSGGEIHWTRPVVQESSKQIYLSDGKSKVYRIGLENSPAHLRALAQAELDLRPKGQMSLLGDSIYVAQSIGDNDEIVAINASDLTSSPNKWPLEGRVAWGPQVVGDVVLASSAAGGLLCLDAEQKERWKVKLSYGSLAGAPIMLDGKIALASVTGTIWQIDASTGETRGSIELGQPLGTGPNQFGKRFVVLGADSTIYVLGASEN